MKTVKDTIFPQKLTLNIHGKLYTLTRPWIMGVLNCTPDSFFDGGRNIQPERLQQTINEIISDGAAIIDVGGCSSRPGSVPPSEEEEWMRIEPALKLVLQNYPDTIISIDTYRASVIEKAAKYYRVDMVNDITAGRGDSRMIPLVASLHLPFIAMHMKGMPLDMQQNPDYENLLDEIMTFFAERISLLRQQGIIDIMIDPGFGFGKTLDHNFELLANLHVFSVFGVPLVAGLSRKSMIWKPLGTNPEGALNGTIAAQTIALMNGANILRVHDVKAAAELTTIVCKSQSFNHLK